MITFEALRSAFKKRSFRPYLALPDGRIDKPALGE